MHLGYNSGLRKPLSQRGPPCSFCAVTLSIVLLVARAVQQATGQTCTTNATYTACPSALEAAQYLTGSNSLLPIANAYWNATANCNAPGFVPYIKITDFGPCHYWNISMPAGALVLCNGDAVLASKVRNAGAELRQDVDLSIPASSADPDLLALAKAAYGSTSLYDSVSLTFDITAAASGAVFFQYVFGSEEYPQYAPGGSQPGMSQIIHACGPD
eukprot:GHUV01025211.1.p1 GENE.GHUV01025211.1~~GHUV01025211.1.p1  ORF type:complete len:215 (+),score=46.66 GHUV01025211.1:533-1177(+)